MSEPTCADFLLARITEDYERERGDADLDTMREIGARLRGNLRRHSIGFATSMRRGYPVPYANDEAEKYAGVEAVTEGARPFGCILPAEMADDEAVIHAFWADACRAQGGVPVEAPSWRVVNPVLDEIDGVKQEPVLIVEGLAQSAPTIDPCGGNTRGGPGCTCDPSF